jgi:hypothetical protein
MEREVGVPAEILIFDQPKGMECNFNDSPDLKYTLLSLEKISSQNDPKRVILDSGTFELEQTQLVYFIQQRIIDSLNWFESELVIFIEGYRLGLTYQAIDIKQESFLARSDSLLRSISITTTNSSSKTNASDSVNLKGNASNEASE